jgi:radical SAM protein with 4Fe4S-binding SPASM domain
MPRQFWRVNIEISNICNLQCSFCPEVIRDKKIMSLALFERTLDEVAPLTKMVTLHLMGDPLVHPQLGAFVEACAKRDLPIFLVTNGILLRPKEVEILLHPIFHQISFSLHSFADNFPQKDPTHYLENIFRFTDRAMKERPELFINYRLWNMESARGQHLENRKVLERVEEHFGVTLPDWDFRSQKNQVVTKSLSLHFDTEFIWPSLELPIIGTTGTCHGLTSHFGVLVDGTVVPCCLDKEGNIPLGNIATESIKEILASPRAQKMIRGFRSGNLEERLCQSCNYIERFNAESRPTP